MDIEGYLLFIQDVQAVRQSRIPFSHQDNSFTGRIETMSPASSAIDRQGALMVTSMNMAVGPHVFSSRKRIAQVPLRNDLNRPVVWCRNVYHLDVYERVGKLIF